MRLGQLARAAQPGRLERLAARDCLAPQVRTVRKESQARPAPKAPKVNKAPKEARVRKVLPVPPELKARPALPARRGRQEARALTPL